VTARKPLSETYRVWLRPAVHRGRRRLPGNVRQRVKRLIDGLRHEPRPATSLALEVPPAIQELLHGWEVRRARIEDWRVVYAIDASARDVVVLIVARRPPYRYEDLEDLLRDLARTGR
jgi:mRNA-degrading endonuclease RelE of RelBE toxin-antitoxin system